MVSLLVVGLFLVSCGSPGPEARGDGGDPEHPVHHSPGKPPASGPARRAEAVRPRRGLIDARPHPFDRVVVEEDDRTLTVYFWSGPEGCHGLDRVEVDPADDAVTVTLYEGRVPGAQVCAEVALYKSTRVRLDEPLAGRRILDGAKG